MEIQSWQSKMWRVDVLTCTELDPKIIQIKEGWNSREATDPQNSNHIAELAASIREVGVKKPLVCYMENDIVYVTDGHCRLAGRHASD
jgi:hypothetical protein